jgi:adhesin transport system membrane fusion protein
MSSNALAVRTAPPAHHDPDVGPGRIVAAMVVVIALFMVVAVVWATVAELDVSVQARGAVVPPSRLQEVQSLDGGIVEQMLVAAGDKVRKGQVLARLDTAQAKASEGESRQHQLAALAGRARVDALLSGSAPRFDDAWRTEAPELIAKEVQLWRDALSEYQSSLAVGREGVQRRRGELAEAQSRIVSLTAAVRLGEESFAIEERLFQQGAGARADYLGAQAKLQQQRAELESLQQSLPRLQAGLAEAQAQLAEATAKARAQWGAQRSDFETKAAALQATLGGQQDKVARRELVSPVDGTVNRVLVPTLGGVAQPGKAVLEVVPEESTLLLNVRVKPSDIGFIHAGQDAHVRVLAYDTSTYGKMSAKVERVGADAIVDEKNERGEPYFEVQLSAAIGQLKLHGKPLPITPGMPVDVGILTGRRSVMQYIIKPVLRGVQGALQER